VAVDAVAARPVLTRHLTEEALVVLLGPGDDLPFALDHPVELAAVQPHAAALRARIDEHVRALDLHQP
jgi:hypothetical protein